MVFCYQLFCYKPQELHNIMKFGSRVYERQTTAKAFAKNVSINQERKLGVRRLKTDTVVVLAINYDF